MPNNQGGLKRDKNHVCTSDYDLYIIFNKLQMRSKKCENGTPPLPPGFVSYEVAQVREFQEDDGFLKKY
jgi:hypothetical protein